VNGRGFTRDAMATYNNQKLNGRMICERALAAIAICKLVQKYHDDYVNTDATNPSDKTMEECSNM
jgi:hypothetical protein